VGLVEESIFSASTISLGFARRPWLKFSTSNSLTAIIFIGPNWKLTWARIVSNTPGIFRWWRALNHDRVEIHESGV
jgi:hypothetical protein